MNKRLNDYEDRYDRKNCTVIIVDISGFAKMVYNTDHTTGKNITLRLLSSIIRNNQLGLSIAEIEGDAIFFYKFGRPPSHAEVLRQYEIMLADFKRTLDKTDQ